MSAGEALLCACTELCCRVNSSDLGHRHQLVSFSVPSCVVEEAGGAVKMVVEGWKQQMQHLLSAAATPEAPHLWTTMTVDMQEVSLPVVAL